jgi:hypothetical protein
LAKAEGGHYFMTADPRAEYSRRIDRWNSEIARADRAHRVMANARLVVAAATAVLAWQAFVSHRVGPAWPLLSVAGFVVLAIFHARVFARLEHARRARQLYERGIARLDATWAGSGPDGARFLDDAPFAHDLDLFGPASLFQLLDTARTQAGEEMLAAWLCTGAEIDEIRARQDAVAELSPRVEFREDLAVLAAESSVGRTGALMEWAASPPVGLSRVHAVIFAASAVMSLSLVVLVGMERIPSEVLLLWILVQSSLVGIWRGRISAAVARIEVADHDLGLMSALLERIEREPVVSPRLAAVRAALLVEGSSPSRRIAALRRLVSWLDQATLNLWFRPIGALLLVRSQMAIAIDRWHAVHGPTIPTWLRAIGEYEAFSAFATYSYEHPADPFPTLVDEGPVFHSTSLGHPLIAERTGVRNDVSLGGPSPCALIVSGSNMSGKSTLLRAVGVNAVLAMAGAPVRAAGLTLSPLAIGTTLRIDDSLAAGHSRFYAEILRVRGIVDLARGPRPVLFLLDEILGGTNSYDRRIGAEAIVRTLVEAGAIGLITTHDLALTELASKLGQRVANVHFEDRIENGRMVFDYRMRPGVVERSNALALMRAVGLDV